MMQDIYDRRLITFVKKIYREVLLENGLHIENESYYKDFYYLLMDHTSMMLAWEIEKYFLGYTSEKRIKEIVDFKMGMIKDATNEWSVKQ
ncbi:hypothetical protein LC087_12130 [Bacillus carboniphilus]|uniref:Uncharacterized protein n=1 Tax=Bacillus carboniphilus TaxID=86663 RepID=A0ABY9JVB7_9BACI|nr:hypothetical protein [Bacillus carboniphilus]WLR41626.1 hypothetical protein LC087_12130 [Bacillus carboniphilus]